MKNDSSPESVELSGSPNDSPSKQGNSLNSCIDSEKGSREKKDSNRNLVKSIFIALLAGILINVFIGLLVDFKEFFIAFKQASLLSIVLPFCIVIVVYSIDTLRYRMVFRKFKIRISLRDAFYNNVIGYFFSSITPGSVGGQPFQVVHFSRLGIDSTTSSNVVFSRLIEGNLVQLAIVILFFHKGIGMMAVVGKGAFLLIAGMVATIILTIVLVLSFLNPHLLGVLALKIEKSRVGKLIAKLTKDPCWAEKTSAWSLGLGDGFKVLWHHNTWTMVADIFLFLVDQLLWALALYIPLRVFTGGPVPIPEFLLSFILCGLISLFIPTPGGSGSVEAAYQLVLSALTGKPAATLGAILIWRFSCYYMHLLIGALTYFFIPMKKNTYFTSSEGVTSSIRSKKHHL